MVKFPLMERNKSRIKRSLKTANPVLAWQWHPTKNGKLKPRDVTLFSNKKVWWICKKGHEWEARVCSRTKGRSGCPYCNGHAVCEDNCLKTINPSLSREWHPIKNGNLTPKDASPSSHKKVWWRCKRGHEWQAIVANRSNGTGCPYCSGRAICEDNCLQTIMPVLAREWHPTKNKKLTPRDVTAFSHKKVWWLCKRGHEWQAGVHNRTNGKGCPYCSNHVICEDNCLQTVNPALAREWHPTKNKELTPIDVMPNTHKRVWWRCKKGHEWQAPISNRSSGRGCPYCGGKAVCEDNCLQTINPNLAREWHPTLNGSLTPKDVTSGSSKRVWWQCNWYHEWKAEIYSRNNDHGCRYCWRKLQKGLAKY